MKNIILIVALLILRIEAQEVIDFQEKGRDNGIRSTRDQDYEEALLDAKRKVLEKSGIEIEAYSKVEDFQLIKDLIESKSEGIILPGMNISDFGYDENGYYQVFIIGRIKIVGETILDKKIRYIVSMYEREKELEAFNELNKIITSSNDDNIIVQAMYYKIIWALDFIATTSTMYYKYNEYLGVFGSPIEELIEKMKSYYPSHVLTAKVIAYQNKIEQEKIETETLVPVYFSYTSDFPLETKTEKTFFGADYYYRGIHARTWCKTCKLYLRKGIGFYGDIAKLNEENPNKYQDITVKMNFNKEYNIDIYIATFGKKNSTKFYEYDEVKEIEKSIKINTPAYIKNVEYFLLKFHITYSGKVQNVSFKSL